MGGSRFRLHFLPKALFSGQKLFAYLQGWIKFGVFRSGVGAFIGGDIAV